MELASPTNISNCGHQQRYVISYDAILILNVNDALLTSDSLEDVSRYEKTTPYTTPVCIRVGWRSTGLPSYNA